MEAVMTYAQAFFGWLLQTTLIASLVICLILLIQKILGNKLGPRWSYALWLVLLVRMILPWSPSSRVSLSNLVPSWKGQTQSLQIPNSAGQQDTSVPTQASETSKSITGGEAESETVTQEQAAPSPRTLVNAEAQSGPQLVLLRRILPIIWLVVAILIGAYLLISDLALWRIVKRDHPLVNQSMLELFEKCKAQMGFQSLVVVVPSDRVRSPGLFGFVRPRLLLPRQMLDTATTGEMRYVFLHELAHLRRHDIYVGWLTSLLQILHWFNPLVWFAFYRMRADRELACDALVLMRTGQDKSQEYGGAIVDLLRRFSRSRLLPAMAGILENKSQLKRRIAMITQFKKNSYHWSPLVIIVIIILGCISLPDRKSTKVSRMATSKSVPTSDVQQADPVIQELQIDIGWNTAISMSRNGSKLSFCRQKYDKENIIVYNIVTGEETEVTKHVTGGAWVPVFSPDGNQIAYTFWDDSKTFPLHIVSLQTGEDRHLGYSGFTLDWSRDGRFILIVDSNESAYSILSIKEDTVEKKNLSLPSEANSHRFSPDGKFISYSNKGNLYLCSVQGGTEIQITRGANEDSQPIWSSDGKELIFLSRRAFGPEPDLCAVSVVDNKAVNEVSIIKPDFGHNVEFYSMSETGRLLYKRRLEDRQIFSTAINPQTGQPKEKPVRLCSGWHPVWSPDGKRIAYISEGMLHVMSADGRNDQEIMRTGFHVSGTYSWAPDNDTIYIPEARRGGVGIYKISVLTKERQTIVPHDDTNDAAHLTCSPDGNRLAFLKPAPPSGNYQIFIVDVDGTNLQQLTSYEDGYVMYPAWSPDGKEIAFEYGPGGGIKTLIVISVDGRSTREVFRGTSFNDDRFFMKTWSPDGSKIAWSTWNGTRMGQIADGKYETFKVNIDGTYGSYEPQGPNWSPDGTKMLFFTYKIVTQLMIMDNFLPKDIGK